MNTFWKGQNPIGQRLRPSSQLGDKAPWFTVVGVAKDVKQGGVDQKTGHEIYALIDQAAARRPAVQLRAGHVEHGAAHDAAARVAVVEH